MSARAISETFMRDQHFNNYLLYQLAMVSHAVSSQFHAELATMGVKPVAWRILYCLWSSPGMRLTELARHVLFKQPRVTKQVAQLEKAGLVKKTTKVKDRRNVYLRLTKKGCALVYPLIEKSVRHEGQVLSILDERDRVQFRKTLSVLISNLPETKYAKAKT